jgi:hypothetical protein
MRDVHIYGENLYMLYKFRFKSIAPLILVAALNWKRTVNIIISKPITKTAIINDTVTTTRMIIMVTL